MNEIKYTDTVCRLYGTPYCELLNQKSCEKCYVSKLDAKEQLMVMEDIRLIADDLPDDGFEELLHSEECGICKGSRKGEAACYAQVNLGRLHPDAVEDTSKRRRYRRDASLTIPVQIPACSQCRRRVLKYAFVPMTIGVLIAALGLVCVSLEPVRLALVRGGRSIPFLVFLIFVFLGIIAESLLKTRYARQLERKTYMRTSRIPAIRDMIRRGWFPIAGDGESIGYTFSSRPLSVGILTGERRAELIAEIRGERTKRE